MESHGTKPIRVLVCGGRDFDDYGLLEKVLDEIQISVVIEGEARGADTLARTYAERRGSGVCAFPAQWNKHGKAAGYIRNAQMLKEGLPELVIAFPGGAGTKMMIKLAREAGIAVKEIL